MVSKKESLRDAKVLRNFLNLTKKGQSAHLDYIAHLEMLRRKRKEREEFIEATLVISLVVALGGGVLFMILWLIL